MISTFYLMNNTRSFNKKLLYSHFLEKGVQPTGIVHDISRKAGVFMELCLNQQIKLN